MSKLQSKVNRTVQGFVAQVIELVRHTALETVQTAFMAPAPTGPIELPGVREPVAVSPGRRRTPADLDALARRVATVVQAHPGLRIAELAERLGTPTRHLSVPLRKLVAEGAIQARGRRRATTYVATAAPDAPGTPDTGAAAPAASSAAPQAGLDAEWYRCLTGVYMLARKLDK